MNKEISTPLASWATQTSVSPWMRTSGIVLAGSALLAACSHVALPLWFTPVPLTLQPFAVLLLGLLLAPRVAAATLGAYLVEGALGLPVFTPGFAFAGGLAHLTGLTGGYLLSYPLAAMLTSFAWRRTGRGFSTALVSAAMGNSVILICGALWLAAFTHVFLGTAAGLAIFPFLPGDALKVVAAASLVTGFNRLRRRNA